MHKKELVMLEIKVDALGELCPIPLIKAEKALTKAKIGDKIILETDHSCTLRFLAERLRKFKCKIISKEVAYGIWQIEIEKI